MLFSRSTQQLTLVSYQLIIVFSAFLRTSQVYTINKQNAMPVTFSHIFEQSIMDDLMALTS